MYGHLKVDTAERVVEVIGPLRDRAQALLQERSELDRILRDGAERAQAQAEPLLAKVKKKVGFIPCR